MTYTNSDAVGVIAQRFDPDNPSAVSVSSRRRDGGTRHGISGSVPLKFVRPFHVPAHGVLNVDAGLLASLLHSSGNHKLAVHIRDAIAVYNRANSDADGTSDEVDLVLLRVALETLTRSTHFADDLQKRVANLTGMKGRGSWNSGPFNEKVWKAAWPKSLRPFDAWLADFCSARNASAHGNSSHAKSRKSQVWSNRNHLMFASWLVPLLVKKALARSGLYRLTEEDEDFLSGFELFLTEDVSFWDEEHGLKWNELEQSFIERRIDRALRHQLSAARRA